MFGFSDCYLEMDLPSLAVILQGVLSPNPTDRKAAEESLNQVLSSLVSAFEFVLSLRSLGGIGLK